MEEKDFKSQENDNLSKKSEKEETIKETIREISIDMKLV